MKPPSPRSGANLPTALISAVAGAGIGVFIARNFFLTEKKIRHRITTEFGAEDPLFIRTMSDFLGPTLLTDNRLTLLNNVVQSDGSGPC